MEVRVLSTIKIIIDGVDDQLLTNNDIKGEDVITDIATGFKTLNTISERFVLDTTTGAAFSKSVDVTNASFIHIQCNKYIQTPVDKPDARRFNVNYNAADIGNMSQFQVINCDDIKALVLSDVVVPTGEKVVLTIVKGYYA